MLIKNRPHAWMIALAAFAVFFPPATAFAVTASQITISRSAYPVWRAWRSEQRDLRNIAERCALAHNSACYERLDIRVQKFAAPTNMQASCPWISGEILQDQSLIRKLSGQCVLQGTSCFSSTTASLVIAEKQELNARLKRAAESGVCG